MKGAGVQYLIVIEMVVRMEKECKNTNEEENMKKKILTSVLSVAMIASVCGPLAACGNGGGPTHFTWWLTVGDPSYYREYENNPVIQYITENVQFSDYSDNL